MSIWLNKLSAFMYKHCASILVLIASVLASYFIFAESFIYLFNAIKNFGLQIAILFCKIFGISNNIAFDVSAVPNINDFNVPVIIPSINGGLDNIVSGDYSLMQIRAEIFGNMFVTGNTYRIFGIAVVQKLLMIFISIIYFIIPIILLICFFVKRYFKNYYNINNDFDKCTIPLKIHKSMSKNFYMPFINYVRFNFTVFINSYYFKIFIIINLFNYNVVTLIIELFTYLLNFYSTFDLINKEMVFKLIFYFKPILKLFPWWIIIVLLLKKFNNKRFERAKLRRYHMDNKDKGFVNSLSCLYLIQGGPGAGKDYLGTDIALTRENLWKYNAKQTMLKADTMFPKFDFLKLALYVENLYKKKSKKSLTSLSEHFRKRAARFAKLVKNIDKEGNLENAKELLFNYDFSVEPLEYCDGVKYITLFKCIEDYALSYYIYLMDSTLISNYSVRQDNYKISFGNMVYQDNDYLAITPDEAREHTHYSLRMNQDDFRLYNKMDPKSKATFEIGNVVWTEIDKDYGNMLDTKGQDIADEKGNSKNDGLLQHFKLIRSAGMIDNKLYDSVSGTAQRDMNVSINIRDISDKIQIIEKLQMQYCYLFGNWEMRFFDWLTEKYHTFYEKFRLYRGDNTLLLYVFKWFYAKLYRYFDKLKNDYGYIEYHLLVDNKEYVYYSLTKKMRANRYSSDVYNRWFRKLIYDSKTGILDMTNFTEASITTKEIPLVNSYFFNELADGKKKNFGSKNKIKNKVKKEPAEGLSNIQKKFLKNM